MMTFIGVLVVAGAAAFLFLNTTKKQDVASILTFEECKQAGYPIMESFPEQCATPDGRTFIDKSQVPPGDSYSSDSVTRDGCVIGGCSGQLCLSTEEAAGAVTTCEYSAAYACYKEASCEPQPNGKCGWTETAELTACLQNPPPLESGNPAVY